ncbi:MAG: LysR family transcriptional regulator [Paracoccaceae bacterium]
MLEIRDLRLVQAIVQHGNLARGARVLGIGQPVLTRRLADLEHRVGGALFDRAHRGAEPTDLCRALLTDAEAILSRMGTLERRLVEVRGQHRAELRVGAGGYAVETVAISAVAGMLSAQPSLRVRLLTMNWADTLTAVREREVELGILELAEVGEAPDLVVEPMQRHPGFFVVRAGHPLLHQENLALADILRFPFIFLRKMPIRVLGPFAKAREAANEKGRAHPAFPAVIHESPAVALRIVLESDAVAAMTTPIVSSALRAGEIAVLPWRAAWVSTNFGIVRVRGLSPSPGSVKFVELLREADRRAFDAGQALLAALDRGASGPTDDGSEAA